MYMYTDRLMPALFSSCRSYRSSCRSDQLLQLLSLAVHSTAQLQQSRGRHTRRACRSERKVAAEPEEEEEEEEECSVCAHLDQPTPPIATVPVHYSPRQLQAEE